MALPIFSEARPFYQAAKQRFQDAEFLLGSGSHNRRCVFGGIRGRMHAKSTDGFEMARRTRHAAPDEHVQRVLDILADYEASHPHADIEVYRQNSVSIRIRIIAPDFQGMDRVERDDELWTFLSRLPEEVQSEMTLLLLLTPGETTTSFANSEFENPIPSQL
jgi:stress-induced morphogen